MKFAGIVALTQTAKSARDRMKTVHIPHAFKAPTPYAMGAPRAVPATKDTMSSAVLLKDFGGTPAEKYLQAEIEGGPRRPKRFEKALSYIGALPTGGFITPGSGFTQSRSGSGFALDQYGNIPGGAVVKLMSILKAFGEHGYRANRRKKWSGPTQEGQIFVVKAGANRPGLKPGIYKRLAGGKVVALIIFPTKAPEYKVRLPFDDLVYADADELFPGHLETALQNPAYAGWR